MFNWIKKLTGSASDRSKLATQTQSQTPKVTRTVRRIVPTNQQNQPEQETPPALPAEDDAPIPTLSFSKNAPSPVLPAKIAFPQPSQEVERPVEPTVESHEEVAQPPVVRIAPTPLRLTLDGDMEEEETAPASAVQLTAPTRRSAIRMDAPSEAANKEIVLNVGDFISRIPTHFVNENAVNTSDEVRFDAADLYSDMSKGRATVPLSIIAEVIPNLFKRSFSPEEDIEIQLPLPKIVAQMGDLLTHANQEKEDAFEEVETPFLKAAQQDGKIHKVSGAISAEKVKPAPPVSFSPPAATKPKPVKLSVSPDPEPEAPTLPKVESVADSRKASRRVTVRVRPLIQAMPLEQREALLGIIPEDSQVDLPLDEIEEQLPSGRVFLPLATFSEALNPNLRERFNQSFTGSDVPISLSEIVKNLPVESMQLRDDQTEQEVDPNEFETPFNTTPDSIAVRPVAPPPLSAAIPAGPSRAKPMVTPAFANYTTRKLNSSDGRFPSPMHAALNTKDPLDAKKIVKLASSLPGVASLTVITGDGLSLAGNLPSFMDPEGFSAMAPQLHRKIAAHVQDMKLGDLKHLSITTEAHSVTIFTSREMAIAVLHQNQSELGHGVREKFVAIVDGLAKQYSQPVEH